MDDVKIYTPEVIDDGQFPQDQIKADNSNTYSPTEIEDNPMPSQNIASELISVTLNTQTQKILGEYRFTPTGAIQVGTYVLNSSGDIRISPDGVVARNDDGDITFTLDGTTGSAIFKGQVLAGSLVSGNVTVGGVNNEDGTIVVNDSSSNALLRMDNEGYGIFGTDGRTFYMKDTYGGSFKGFLGYFQADDTIQLASFGNALGLFGDHGINALSPFGNISIATFSPYEINIQNSSGDIKIDCDFLNLVTNLVGMAGDLVVSGILVANSDMVVNGNLLVGGAKSAQVDTSKGKVLYYAAEAPDNWFVDFYKGKPDPIFLETTTKPYHEMKMDDGYTMIWGKRKDVEPKRFGIQEEVVFDKEVNHQSLDIKSFRNKFTNEQRDKILGRGKKGDRATRREKRNEAWVRRKLSNVQDTSR